MQTMEIPNVKSIIIINRLMGFCFSTPELMSSIRVPESATCIWWADSDINSQLNTRTRKHLSKCLNLKFQCSEVPNFGDLLEKSSCLPPLIVVSGKLKQLAIDFLEQHPSCESKIIVYCYRKADHQDAYNSEFVKAVVDNYGDLEAVIAKEVQIIESLSRINLGKLVIMKDKTRMQLDTSPTIRQSFVSAAEFRAQSGEFTFYAPIKHYKEYENVEEYFKLPYDPMQQFSTFKKKVISQIDSIRSKWYLLRFMPPQPIQQLESINNYSLLCRQVLLIVTQNQLVIQQLGKTIFTKSNITKKSFSQLILAVCSNFIFFRDHPNRHRFSIPDNCIPVEYLSKSRGSLIECSNLTVANSTVRSEAGFVTMIIETGLSTVTDYLFSPCVEIQGKCIWAPFSRFLLRTIGQEKNGHYILVVSEVWAATVVEKICALNIFQRTNKLTEMVQRVGFLWPTTEEPQDRNLIILWCCRYFLNRYLKTNSPDDLIQAKQALRQTEQCRYPQWYCLNIRVQNVSTLKIDQSLIPKLLQTFQTRKPQYRGFFLQCSRRSCWYDLRKSSSFSNQYLRLASSDHTNSCHRESLCQAKFLTLDRSNQPEIKPTENLFNEITERIGSKNYMCAFLCDLLGEMYYKRGLEKEADAMFKRGINTWDWIGVVDGQSIGKCFMGLSLLNEGRNLSFEARLYRRKGEKALEPTELAKLCV